VDILFKDRLGLDSFELGLEVLQAGSVAAAVGAAASIGKVKAFILDFFALDTPNCVSIVFAEKGSWRYSKALYLCVGYRNGCCRYCR
jgi:hypothetical protein